ncbi:holo-ACP synthase [Liquorilactobacillus capillatus]|uniref:Holo-[acyl-carrier-protein] synthase n=1 Tax=Liquorilactobacillus capillatus DSM 19910 TaxID=1423731 RepID=A0A0R1M1Q6_9LACO|nr:holo-ACP synthase [Liquorilactobacillus capillatus]KRL01854.1 4-phosphopantetheinyl transferase [Liquorilactobacillus capillatus DSM 19910]
MIYGIGVDITDIARVEKAWKRHQSFVKMILTENEQKFFERLSYRRKNEFLAGRFSAKESYSKALGTGIGKQATFHEIEILNNEETGKPKLTMHPADNLLGHISISHTAELVMTEVILEYKPEMREDAENG